MAAKRKQAKTPKNPVITTADMEVMPTNELLSTLATVMSNRDESYDKLLAAVVNQDIQKHLDNVDNHSIVCPKCGGSMIRKNGKRNNLQRYLCQTINANGKTCGHSFTELSGTILEKTRFSWEAWVEVVYQLINWNSVETTVAVLGDDYHYPNVDPKSVWLMRLKIMTALSTLPSPVLNGVIQVDDTFLRDSQKGSRVLYNPLPESFNVPRLARNKKNKRVRSECGVQGNEFAAITCAIDRSGKCVIRNLGSGAISTEVFTAFLDEHTDGITFLCSDAALPIKKHCDTENIAHYICPSTYRRDRDALGWAYPPETETKAEKKKRREHNRAIDEPMWREKTGPHMENFAGANTYAKFQRVCKEQKLTINAVNSLHAALKRRFNDNLKGVSTKYLPLYLSLFEYLWNKGVIEDDDSDVARGKVVSHKQAEEILIEAIETRTNFTSNDVKEIRSNPPKLGTVSPKKMVSIHRTVESARKTLGEKNFVFSDDVGIEIGRTREYLSRLPLPRLITICKAVDLRQRRKQKDSKTMLVERLAKLGNIRQAILEEQIAYEKNTRPAEVVELPESDTTKHVNVRTSRNTINKSVMASDLRGSRQVRERRFLRL